jgi:signal transduction histidine kinase
MVYGFVQQAGGSVALESTLGHGTTVRLFLPRV